MPPLGPEITDSEFSTSGSGTSHSFTLPAYTQSGDTYALFITWALSASVAQASPISGDPANFTVTDTPETAWIRRRQNPISNDDAMFFAEVWTGSMASVLADEADFTTNVAATAVAVGCVVNTHNSSTTVAVDIGIQPNTGGTDGQVDHTGDTSFAEVEPQIYIDMMMGKLGPSETGTSPTGVPSGYTAEPGGEGPSVAGTTITHYPICYLAWKSSPSGQSSENPGAWSWDEVSDVSTPGNTALITVPFTTFSFEDFTADVLAPYWGISGEAA